MDGDVDHRGEVGTLRRRGRELRHHWIRENDAAITGAHPDYAANGSAGVVPAARASK